MKKRNRISKDFQSFKKRNTHKRRTKERAKNELLRAVMSTNVNMDSVRISDSFDGGRRQRVSLKRHADERIAEGIFTSSKSGFGFVAVEHEERDVFIPQDKTLGAIDGDTVEIVYHTYKTYAGEEKTEGRVREILHEARAVVVGMLDEEHD